MKFLCFSCALAGFYAYFRHPQVRLRLNIGKSNKFSFALCSPCADIRYPQVRLQLGMGWEEQIVVYYIYYMYCRCK